MNDYSNQRGHISAQFSRELEGVQSELLNMGGLVESQIEKAVDATLEGDSRLAEEAIDLDTEVNALERSIDEQCARILALRQPAAGDLRLVLAVIKVTTDLERIGDEAKKIANHAVILAEQGGASEGYTEVRHLGQSVSSMLANALDAFARFDVDAAMRTLEEDKQIDLDYKTALRELVTYMMEDPRSISRMLNLLWALRALERIGDHAKNVSEHVIYLVKGMDVRHEPLENIADRLAGSE